MSTRPCPACGGARLQPEALAVTVGGTTSTTSRALSVHEALATSDELELTDTERLIAERVIREIRERLTFLDDVGVGYLSLDRAAAHALGRRGAAHPARDADRRRASSACSTSSTSRRSACTSATTRA